MLTLLAPKTRWTLANLRGSSAGKWGENIQFSTHLLRRSLQAAHGDEDEDDPLLDFATNSMPMYRLIRRGLMDVDQHKSNFIYVFDWNTSNSQSIQSKITFKDKERKKELEHPDYIFIKNIRTEVSELHMNLHFLFHIAHKTRERRKKKKMAQKLEIISGFLGKV